MHIANCFLSLVSILCPIQSFHLLLSQVVLNIEKYYTWKFLKLSHLYDGLLLEVRVCFFAVFSILQDSKYHEKYISINTPVCTEQKQCVCAVEMVPATDQICMWSVEIAI